MARFRNEEQYEAAHQRFDEHLSKASITTRDKSGVEQSGMVARESWDGLLDGRRSESTGRDIGGAPL